jgi:4-oxalocrotonate tautomerase family enzyme
LQDYHAHTYLAAGQALLAAGFWQLTNGVPMPMVQITMLQGRTADQKRKIAKRITDALVEEAGAKREAIIVASTRSQRKVTLRVAS